MGTMRVDSKGRITLPRELREALCLETDDKVAYECENGILRIAKAGNPHSTRSWSSPLPSSEPGEAYR